MTAMAKQKENETSNESEAEVAHNAGHKYKTEEDDVTATTLTKPTSLPTHPLEAATTTLLAELAISIENELFVGSDESLTGHYRQRLRDLAFNLRTNPTLATRLCSSSPTLTPTQLIAMDNEQLASADVAAAREAARAESMAESVYRPPQRFETDQYLCPACHSQRCSTLLVREERDISKADIWGTKQGAGSVIEIRCEECKHTWMKEE